MSIGSIRAYRDRGYMKGNISLDSIKPIGGSWLVVCGECAGRALQFKAGNRESQDYCDPWRVDSEERAEATLASHDRRHHNAARKSPCYCDYDYHPEGH